MNRHERRSANVRQKHNHGPGSLGPARVQMNDIPKRDDRKTPLVAQNYCLGFVDLLGQHEAVRGEGLMPSLPTLEERERFYETVRASLGAIYQLQVSAERMIAGILDRTVNSRLRRGLPIGQNDLWDRLTLSKITRQRWSDGLACFAALGDDEVACRMNAIFGIFCLCGALCFLGLASKKPIRGAIEVAWGAELHPRELYGPVVARAYDLESKIAEYPRILIGPIALQMLRDYAALTGNDVSVQLDRKLAETCLKMTSQDDDGNIILHYLGPQFRDAVTMKSHRRIYREARKFVGKQLKQHKAASNEKLVGRYSRLLAYFRAHVPAVGA